MYSWLLHEHFTNNPQCFGALSYRRLPIIRSALHSLQQCCYASIYSEDYAVPMQVFIQTHGIWVLS